MTHCKTYGNRPYMVRKKYDDGLYLEIIDMRDINGRIECLSRWIKFEPNGLIKYSFGYRWRKICGKGVFVPPLDRVAKDDHSLSLTILNPISGRRNRAYLRDFKKE